MYSFDSSHWRYPWAKQKRFLKGYKGITKQLSPFEHNIVNKLAWTKRTSRWEDAYIIGHLCSSIMVMISIDVGKKELRIIWGCRRISSRRSDDCFVYFCSGTEQYDPLMIFNIINFVEDRKILCKMRISDIWLEIEHKY